MRLLDFEKAVERERLTGRRTTIADGVVYECEMGGRRAEISFRTPNGARVRIGPVWDRKWNATSLWVEGVEVAEIKDTNEIRDHRLRAVVETALRAATSALPSEQ